MRIAFVDTYYAEFLNSLGRIPFEKTYDEVLADTLARQFGTADFYSREFRKIGWEVIDIIGNYWSLQCRAKGAMRAIENSPYEGYGGRVLFQLEDFKPDVVFVQDLSFFSVDQLQELNKKCVLVAQLSCEMPSAAIVRQFHTIFTSFPHFLPRLKALGVNAVYMPLAFHESVLPWNTISEYGNYLATHERDIDVSFVGGIGWQWKHGLEVLEAVAREIPTFQWWGYGVEQLKADSPLRRCYKGTAWGSQMYQIYQRSKIVINRHGEIAEGYSNNMRMTEVAGCGALLMTEESKNLYDLFPPGSCVCYTSPADLVNRIKFYLPRDIMRSEVANHGQQLVLRRHTYAHRVPKIAEVLTNAMSHA